MAASTVTVVHTGTANIASVLAAITRLGVTPLLTDDAAIVAQATHVVLPGVGSFGTCMAALDRHHLTAALHARVSRGAPTLAVCMGLQLMCEGSEETPDVAGIGVVPAQIRRFVGPVRIPQLGWNNVTPDPACRLLTAGYAYFAHSFRLETVPDGWHGAFTEHGGRYVSALERGRVLLCQFHPELSGPWGQALLQRWISADEVV